MSQNDVADNQAADTAQNEVPAFLHIADRFISLANSQAQENDLATASAGFLYANARFTAFLVASQCGTAEALETEKTAAIEYFVNQYAQALTSNITDYQKNFAQYFSK
ncbi:MAG: hypothetical protein CTY10_02890 [Methylotenera sp.]|nr:MAG: hypothetical protein CTY10_02890 [Methylotenera sp.]